MPNHRVSFHVDIDSPNTLLRFWSRQSVACDLDSFYEIAMDRALRCFEHLGVKATFFCVGKELRESASARMSILEAFRQGHEIANHTYSHPYGLTKLGKDDLRREILDCSSLIQELTGVRPVGFRAPSYEMNTSVMEVLEDLSFKYDSSAFWSILNPLVKFYYRWFSTATIQEAYGKGCYGIPRQPYYPSSQDCMREGESVRGILEIPVPRTRLLNFPFYANFHLSAGDLYSKVAIALMRQPYVVYLFHLIEFVDLADGIPGELSVHPNLSTPFERKLATMEKAIQAILQNYQSVLSSDFAQEFSQTLSVFDPPQLKAKAAQTKSAD